MRKLNVNIDHIVTFSKLRNTEYPRIDDIIPMILDAGASGITCHLREDRRHIEEKHIEIVRSFDKCFFNLEIAPTKEMLKIAQKYRPDLITLVPEKRMELTTEGGFNIQGNYEYIKSFIKILDNDEIPSSIFVNPVIDDILSVSRVGCRFVEVHTGDYCHCATLKKDEEFNKLKDAVKFAKSLNMHLSAGHGIHYSNSKDLANLVWINDFNIGHGILSRALEIGIKQSIIEIKNILKIK